MNDMDSAVNTGAGAINPADIGVVKDDSIDEQEAAKIEQYVSFTVGESEYGIDIMAVREIQGWTNVTKLPNTPHYVRGVLNLRGAIVPIFDLRCRFTGGLTDATPLHVVIIIALGDRIMGLLVDAVSDILTINSDDIMDVPEVETQGDQRFLSGLITVEERMVALLQINKLFDIEELVAQVAGK